MDITQRIEGRYRGETVINIQVTDFRHLARGQPSLDHAPNTFLLRFFSYSVGVCFSSFSHTCHFFSSVVLSALHGLEQGLHSIGKQGARDYLRLWPLSLSLSVSTFRLESFSGGEFLVEG